jgi:hypothetical protein
MLNMLWSQIVDMSHVGKEDRKVNEKLVESYSTGDRNVQISSGERL